MAPPSIETRQLTRRFGSFVALNSLDLHIEGSKCVGFLGPNGAGKTTALKMLTDMIFPSQGEAFLNGISVQKERKKALSQCGVLIETPEIYPSLSPREALMMVGDMRGYPHAERNRRIDDVLAEVKMSDWADRKVGRFSKGMKQRVNLAAALMSDPEILLLDEPTTGLDPRGMAEVRDIVRSLKRDRRLIFMSSHILSEVNDVCDEVALLNKGQLLFHDTLENVRSRFAAGRTAVDAAFARPMPPGADASIRGLEGVTTVQLLDARRARIGLTAADGAQPKLLEALVGLHWGLESLRESSSALEEIYMEQVQKGD